MHRFKTTRHCQKKYGKHNNKNDRSSQGILSIVLAGGQGVEPQLPHPECDVLPLDDPPIREKHKDFTINTITFQSFGLLLYRFEGRVIPCKCTA